VALRSEGMNLSPVELAVPMSEQTQTTAGHGLDLLEPVIIEGSPEALQTVAIQAPITSQIISETVAESDVSLEVTDIETDEQTETLNTTMVPTPAVCLAADSTHLASSVCGAGAAGLGPPPSGPGAAPSPFTPRDPPTSRDTSPFKRSFTGAQHAKTHCHVNVGLSNFHRACAFPAHIASFVQFYTTYL